MNQEKKKPGLFSRFRTKLLPPMTEDICIQHTAHFQQKKYNGLQCTTFMFELVLTGANMLIGTCHELFITTAASGAYDYNTLWTLHERNVCETMLSMSNE